MKQSIKKENPTDPEVKVKEEPLDTFEGPEETEIDVTVDNLLDEAIDELSEKEFPIDNQTESEQPQESAESPYQSEANEPEGKKDNFRFIIHQFCQGLICRNRWR